MEPTDKIMWEDQEYDYILKFDGKIVELGYKEGGSYFTCLAISPIEYRKTNPTKAKASVTKFDNVTIFDISDDWGEWHRMVIPNSLASIIERAISGLKAQNLLN